MKEWLRTLLLVALILLAFAYIIWTHHVANTSLLQGIPH